MPTHTANPTQFSACNPSDSDDAVQDQVQQNIVPCAADPTIQCCNSPSSADHPMYRALSNSEDEGDASFVPSSDVEPEYEGLAVMAHCGGALTEQKEDICNEILGKIARNAKPEFGGPDGSGLVIFYEDQTNQTRLQELADTVVANYPGYDVRVRLMTSTAAVVYDDWDAWWEPMWTGETEHVFPEDSDDPMSESD